MAHLAFTRVDPSILCVFFSEPGCNLIADFDATRDAFLARWPIKYEEQFHTIFSPRRAAALHRAQRGIRGTYLGLAAEESKGRARTCTLGWIKWRDGTRRCTPLGKWTWRDIAAYHAAHDLPCLSTYRQFGFEARTSAGVSAGSHAERGRDLMSSGNLARYDQIINPYKANV
jgi:3'-phosphoadenosine 5'-phosphosulfate sulfotransferase (PAPS reductase)/FAD synthetase